ncbi:DUF317 domain-containing protein [Streptomyces sp. MNU76]|uniref:DUF317 domain-containing protein n=1 Tax=Streptomyces sp. MNU76 TaxID=2560026 RepID=UPI0027DF29F3|nr:DUF317 domain-containing protein [Streptomyces sp. MNU76]
MSRLPTVGQLIHQLQTLAPDRPALLAINPDWPFAHFIGRIVEGEGDNGPTVYIAEDGQHGYLPRPVCDTLGWHEESWAPGLHPAAEGDDPAPWYLDGQDAAYVVTELFHRPRWTAYDNDVEGVYTGPGGHLTARCADNGWSFEARRTPGGEEVWHADFDAAVPPTAIKAFATVLLGPEPTV